MTTTQLLALTPPNYSKVRVTDDHRSYMYDQLYTYYEEHFDDKRLAVEYYKRINPQTPDLSTGPIDWTGMDDFELI
jgi:hypothetical protein